MILISDKELKKKEGIFTWYYDNGALQDSVVYESGKRKTGWYFYENGNRKATVAFTDGKISEQSGWGENGEEISNYILKNQRSF
jgi:antitoxin component YwqK of YwqJK toxin-antitoxin module